MSPELVVLLLNFVTILITYQIIYPAFAGRDLNKLIVNDFIAMAVVLGVAWALYADTDTEFSILITSTNWFWFTLLTYFVIETPFAKRYIVKHRLFG